MTGLLSMMKFNRRSLRYTALAALLLALGLALLAIWRATLQRTEQQVRMGAEKRAEVLAASFGAQLQAAGPEATAERRHAILDPLSLDTEHEDAVLLGERGMILASTDRELENKPLVKTPLADLVPIRALTAAMGANELTVIHEGNILACVYPVVLTSKSAKDILPSDFSSLVLYFDISDSLAIAKASVKEGLWLATVLLIAFAAAFAIAAKVWVFDRLLALNEAARRVAKGDFSTQARLPGQDEIAQLSQSLNQVAAWVENSTSALRDSERNYRELVETSNDLIWAADAQGRWTFVNRSAAMKIYGFKPEEMLGRRIAAFAMPETEDDNVIAFEQIDKGQEHIQFDTVHQHKDGTPVYLSFSGLVQRDMRGKVESLTGIARDTTRRRQAEEQVREQASLLDLASDAIFVRDLEDRVLFWNRSCERLFGWTRDEALGEQSTKLAFRDLQAVGEAQQAVLTGGEWMGELRPVGKNGREILVSSRWTLVRDAQDRPKSMLCINTDITEKKQLEAQFLRVQRLEGIGTLASGIAHDLNNVFSPITISLTLLKDKLTEPSAAKMLGVLSSSAKRGADIVRQLLTFARGSEGRMGILQPAHILKELTNIINGTFPKTIRLEFAIPKDTWPVMGDATRLHQVLLNLCINARDAMPEGGRLVLKAVNAELDDHFARLQPEAKPGPHVVIEVTDSGCGIPPENLRRIFDPFFTTKEPGKGTGLGLSTALGIVRSHGGFITVKSTPGAGTTFKVHLPAQPSQEGELSVRPTAPLPRGQGETVLIVEDEESIRAATVATLEVNGYRTLTAVDGIEARAVFRENQARIRLVLTDLMMPRRDGPRFIRDLREMDLQVPIIVSTGLDAEAAAQQVGNYGIAVILEKPYTGDDLIRAVHRTLLERDNSGNEAAG
jgi:PAS domain S-box-containing protein